MTSARFPLSSRRPLMTSTVSPLRIFTLIFSLPGWLEHFRSQRNNLHETLLAQFAGHRAKNAAALRVLTIRIQDDGSIVIETDIRTILTPPFLRTTNNDSFDNFALLDGSLRGGGLHCGDHNVANVGVPARRTAHHMNDEQLA